MPIDFSNIRPYRDSQNEAFEELVCQIVRRGEAAGSDSWVRLYGAGGDGGIEAFWYPLPVQKTGIQAKYFLKTADIGWEQIQKSFRTALSIHPDLVEYRVYLACDLTGPTNRKGKSGVDLWNDTRTKMIADAQGRAVRIRLFTASDLMSDLANPATVGLAEFWFGAIEINPAKLRGWLDNSIIALGERYHPEDHVEVDVQSVLEALSRSPRTLQGLEEAIEQALDCQRLPIPQTWAADANRLQQISKANKALEDLETVKREISSDPGVAWPVAAWLSRVEAVEDAVRTLARDSYDIKDKDSDRNDAAHFRNRADEVTSALRRLVVLLRGEAFKAEASRLAIIVGPGGCGKSHLLAAAAKQMLEEGAVVILLLGHRLTDAPIWQQIAQQLDAPGKTKQEILGALDAAGVITKRRAVILLDALNEGGLRSSWLQEFEAFANDILAFPYLALAVSCRDVFQSHIISSQVAARFPIVALQGFESEEEQERAAQIYLDRRGIARPSMPWLAPEFVNPLFLRSVTSALKAQGKHSIPTGLIGTKQLLAFYIDALARSLGTQWDGSEALAAPCKGALVSIAAAMAANQRDWIDRAAAGELVSGAFTGYAAPPAMSWLDVLLRNGVLREDPNPEANDPNDPMSTRPDVVRFAFQRFQDHLMADTLLAGVTDATVAFADGGPLNFLLTKAGQFWWTWQGLTEALSIQLPEKLETELVDVLPGGEERHWGDFGIERAFIQSIKWREPRSISKRSLELANKLRSGAGNLLDLLIELAPRTEHPWNADMLDRNLRSWPLPDRDQRWTMHISSEGNETGHPINRLIEWCSKASKDSADDEVLRLSSVALAWALTSTASWIRDRATKALTSLFTDRPGLFEQAVQKFSAIDDLYVAERILAAGYGSLLRWPDKKKAEAFSSAVWDAFFGQGYVPPNLLLLDYAQAIVEIAEREGGLAPQIDIAKTRPPFDLAPPVLDVTKEQIEQIAKEAGGEQILHSCGEFGDFQRYEVQHRVGEISTVPLSKPAPTKTSRQIARAFETEVIDDDAGRRKALEDLRTVCFDGKKPLVLDLEEIIEGGDNFDISVTIQDHTPEPEWQKRFDEGRETLVSLLDPSEIKRFEAEWLPEYDPTSSSKVETPRVETFSSMPASWWIAKRAYELGWTQARFGDDLRDYGDRQRPRVERIGKKYQWIARSELLARLVSNYWLTSSYDDGGSKAFQKITDISFERDIDPSLFESPKHKLDEPSNPDLLLPQVCIEPIEGIERLKWPFVRAEGPIGPEQVVATDQTGQRWIRLSWYVSKDRHTKLKRRSFGHNFAQREFAFLRCVVCKAGKGKELFDSLKLAGHVDLHDWRFPELTDGPFLYELASRSTWPAKQWEKVGGWRSPSYQVAWPFEEYLWESHLDKSLPDGARAVVLAPWLMEELSLIIDSRNPRHFRNLQGELIAVSRDPRSEEQHGLCIREDVFASWLKAGQLECVWMIVGEREAWSDGDQEGARAYRRFNTVILQQQDEPKNVGFWNEDFPAKESGGEGGSASDITDGEG